MQSTFTGIELAKRGLNAHNQGLVTIGHNLSNASTEGYSRQRIELSAVDPLYAPELNREESPGQIGQGVAVEKITRVRDELLDGRIVAEAGTGGYWSTRDRYVLALEEIHNEPSDSSVRSLMDRFWGSWQELAQRPEDLPAREAIVSRGQALAEGIRDRYRRLTDLRSAVDGDLRGSVDQVNALAKEIASLNGEIVKSKALGDQPNDLMDRRDLLVERLGALVPVSVDRRDRDELMIHVDGIILVQGKVARSLELRGADSEGFARPVWKDTGLAFSAQGGSLGALVELRDGDLRSEIQGLDTMALSFSDLVNETHRAGYGLNGKTGLDFFSEYPSVNNVAGNYDSNGDGAFDTTMLYRMTGANSLEGQEQLGLAGTLTLSGPMGRVEVAYHPTDTVADLVDRMNHAGAEVTARLDRLGRLELRGAPASTGEGPDFVIRHVEDSGRFLAGYAGLLAASGSAGAYDWGRAGAAAALAPGGTDFAVAPLSHPSGWLEVNSAIVSDPGSIAAGFGENGKRAEAGDGSAALAIAALRTRPVMVGSQRTFDDHFAEAVARIGLKGERAQIASQTHDRIAKDLSDLRQSISGVNMDEELADMIKFQHGYSASARFMSVINDMLDTIINKLGV